METTKEVEDLQKRIFKAYTVIPVDELDAQENKIKQLEEENVILKASVESLSSNVNVVFPQELTDRLFDFMGTTSNRVHQATIVDAVRELHRLSAALSNKEATPSV